LETAPENSAAPAISIVVPVFDEADNLAPQIDEICAAFRGRAPFEIIYVDDHSADDSWARLMALKGKVPELRALRHTNRSKQSAAVMTGVRAARASWCATLDGDCQNVPADLPGMWDLALAESGRRGKPVAVLGWRKARQDTWSKKTQSRIANLLRQAMLGDGVPDSGCGIKVFPTALYASLPYFDHMHRFAGALLRRAGADVLSVPVGHRPRVAGVSKNTLWNRALVGLVDMIGVMWLNRRMAQPGRVDEA